MFILLYSTDTDSEVEKIISLAKGAGAFDAVSCTHYAQGGSYDYTAFQDIHMTIPPLPS